MNKRRIASIVVGAFLFILLLFFSLALVRPIYIVASGKLSEFERRLMDFAGEQTGIVISYESLSPSLFSRLNINQIKIIEAKSGRVIAKVRKASLSYDAKKFASENPLDALDTLTVTGVEIDFDLERDLPIVNRVLAVFSSGEAKNEKGGGFSLESISLPFVLVVRDVFLHYADSKNEAFVKLKNILLNGISAGGISFDLTGNAEAYSDFLKDGKNRAKIASGFSFSGTIFNGLNGSSATVSLTGDKNADYSVSNLDFLTHFENNKLEVRTMRTSIPLNLFAEYDFSDEKAEVAFIADNFDPLSLFVIRKKNDAMNLISGSTISGNAEAKIDLAGGKLNGVEYKTDISARLTEKIIGEKLAVALKSEGNLNAIKISNLKAQSKTFDAAYSGRFNFKTLQPFGVAEIARYTLPNGREISADLYLEGEKKDGIHIVAPGIMLEEKPLSLEASVFLKKDSLDFSATIDDYSHAEDYSKMTIQTEGSVIFGAKPFVQAGVEIDSLFLDTALQTAAFFLPEENARSLLDLSESVSPYVLSKLELYGSSDFKTFSFNAPYGIFANIQKENEFGIFAADGSNEMAQISSLNVQFGGFSVQADAFLDFAGGFDDIAFSTNLVFNSLPYTFAGNITPKWISVTGDYDFDAMATISDEISGYLQFSFFPVPISPSLILNLSSTAAFSYTKDEGIAANISRFEISEPTNQFTLEPQISFSGELSKYGFIFDNFTYADKNSELDMSGNLSWSFNFDTQILDFARIQLKGKSPISSEGIELNAEVSNPLYLPFSEMSPLNDFYISASAVIDSFPFSRFLEGQGAGNVLNAEISAIGTVADPFVSIDLKSASLNLSGLPLEAKGRAVLNDLGLSVEDFDVSWGFVKIDDFSAEFDPKTFSGKASAAAQIELGDKTLTAPLEISANGVADDEAKPLFAIPQFYSLSVSSKGLEGSFFKEKIPFVLNAVHIPGQFDIFTDNPRGFKASVSEDGSFTAQTGKNDIISFNVEGLLGEGGAMDIFVTDINADLQKITSKVDVPMFSIPKGKLTGDIRLAGLTSDPEFAGVLQIDDISLLIPMLTKEAISAKTVQITAGAEGLNLADTLFSVGKGGVMVSSDVTFDRWNIENIFLNLRSVGKSGIPIDMQMPMMHIVGEVRPDLDISVILPDDMIVQGSVSAQNTEVSITVNELQEKLSLEGLIKSIPFDSLFGRKKKQEKEEKAASEENMMNIVANLDLNVGKQVRIAVNPFLRALIAPKTALKFYMDSATAEFAMTGDVSLHGGEISWLNRNFYLREGNIVFNETQDNIDPLITVRAETREQDSDGNRVTITLSAQNQPVSRFNPVFSSSPAKSEFEIMTLLGQFISGDAENAGDIALAGGDYLVQATVVRRLENALRQLLNFDIFSLRTNVLQNAVRAGLGQNGGSTNGSGNKTRKEDNEITFGNFIDNSTVYIGKYFGSSIYLDAMFHWTYDKNKIDDNSSVSGIVFQPEFGFEMSSPFVNIRLGVAPSVEAIQNNLWVESSSITLSWKYQF